MDKASEYGWSGVDLVREDNSTGWFVGIIVFLATMAIGYLVLSAGAPRPGPLPAAHVKVEVTKGHGSATHIGGGYFVTAAHVVTDQAHATIDGVEAEILWVNRTYEVALLRGSGRRGMVPLECGVPAAGIVGAAFGNPMQIEDISTTMRVAGTAREIGPWKLALPMDGSIGPGMSGGGFIVDGVLAGVNVGALMAPAAGGFPSYYGVSVVVPASVICKLMGRT